MKEITDILQEYNKIDFAVRKAALATVVKVEGSSYRQPGARMLITDDGQLTGAISGGCLEGDALRKALLVISRGKPMLVTYDTTGEDDANLGIGLGCNGIIYILIEPIDPSDEKNPVELLKKTVNSRRKAVLFTLFSLSDKNTSQSGTCCLYTEDGISSGSVPETVPDLLVSFAKEAILQNSSAIKNLRLGTTDLCALVELLNPTVSLVVAGAGNDVIPLVKIAGFLGWQITVLDGRPLYATCRRFPDVYKVLVTEAEQALSKIKVDGQTVFVLMTHNYNYDLAILQQLITMDTPYIGILGPKKKFNRLIHDLITRDHPEDSHFENIYGPVGLDIGAETAEEIALSVVAEIKAVMARKSGRPLRYKTDPIHIPLKEEEIIDIKSGSPVKIVT